jgi:hypothetical protein
MDWVSVAEEYIGSQGWGARGKNLGVSRMFTENSGTTLQDIICKEKVVASQRPRGVLSGFLAVVPNLGYGVYLPPIAAKTGPQRIRLRLSQKVLCEGAIFSVYFNRAKQLVVEDVLTWCGESVWHTKTFKARWEGILADFATNHIKHMLELQGCEIVFAQYMPVNQVKTADTNSVIEFVLNGANTKRIIWIPPKMLTEVKKHDAEVFKAKKELGPDVYSIWRGMERLGLALIRTLAISKAMRLNQDEEGIAVSAEYNKQFDKWEIQAVIPNKKSSE